MLLRWCQQQRDAFCFCGGELESGERGKGEKGSLSGRIYWTDVYKSEGCVASLDDNELFNLNHDALDFNDL